MENLFVIDFLITLWFPTIVILSLCTAAGRWVALRRMGGRRWAALIPVFSTYELCRGASGDRGLEVVATAIDAAELLATLYAVFGSNLGTPATEWLGLALDVAWLASQLVVAAKLSAAFGRGPGYAALVVLVPIVGYPLVVSENNLYLGPVDLPRS